MKLQFTPLDYAVITVGLVYSTSATVTPVCLLSMAKELNFSLSASGGIEGIRSFLLFISMFFGGFIAAKIGKVRSLSGGLFALSFSYAAYAFAPSYIAVLGASLILGASAGILEGLANPLIQDAHPNDSGRYLNITNAFWSVGVLSTVLISGELLTRSISWRLIMGFLSLFSLAAAIFLATLRKYEVHTRTLSPDKVIRRYVDCLRSKRFWVFCFMMLLAGGAEGAFTFWSASYIQIHFAALPRMGGIGTACFAAGMLGMRVASGIFVPQHKLRKAIFLSAVFGVIIASIIPFIHSEKFFFPLLFLAGISIACFWPSIQSYSITKMSYLDSTAAFILSACAGIAGFGLVPFIMGIIGDAAGLEKSFLCVPVLLAVLALSVFFERTNGKFKTSV
ncbi:MFS transporter [Treponema sp. OMZ 840]|uniref:MFS transporter n=1 Tax=Treponema sp. OMZ 840 TaxID=244313 RepID=UPI003D8F4940